MSFREDILIIMTDRHMGNLILAVPAIRSIGESCIDARSTSLVDEAYMEIVKALRDILCFLIHKGIRKQV